MILNLIIDDESATIRTTFIGDIAEKIILLLGNKKLREKLAKTGQKFVKRNYSWPSIIKKFEKIYNTIK